MEGDVIVANGSTIGAAEGNTTNTTTNPKNTIFVFNQEGQLEPEDRQGVNQTIKNGIDEFIIEENEGEIIQGELLKRINTKLNHHAAHAHSHNGNGNAHNPNIENANNVNGHQSDNGLNANMINGKVETPLTPSTPHSPSGRKLEKINFVTLSVQTTFRAKLARNRSYGWISLTEQMKAKVRVLHSNNQYEDAHQKNMAVWKRAWEGAKHLGKGLAFDENSILLRNEHWLESADPKHRYGSILNHYHAAWKQSDAKENFFYWLDEGGGKNVSLPDFPRKKLEASCVKYLSPTEREDYVVTIENGLLKYYTSGEPIVTTNDDKWIYVVDSKGTLYVGKKIRGKFHHSSFLSGGPTKAAGNLKTDLNGKIVCITPSSGHYRPSEKEFNWFKTLLISRGIDFSDIIIDFNVD